MDTISLRPLPEERAAWLHQELRAWERSGLVDHTQAEAIAAQYAITPATRRRLSLGRLMLGLGSVFIGTGLIWLVAANLDQLTPALRFGAVALFWLLFLIGGEVLAARRASPPVVGAVRGLAALAFGATIFQAAQSLQVPAYEPLLLGAWSLGALLHGYAVRAIPPFLVGVGAGVIWYVMEVGRADANEVTMLTAIGLLGAFAVALAAAHARWVPEFAQIWRVLGVAALLGTLFVAAIPALAPDAVEWSLRLVVVACVTGAAVILALLRSEGSDRLEPLGALVVLVAATGLVLWGAGGDASRVGWEDWLHAIVSVGVYVGVAVAVAALGTVRDNPILVGMAMLALVGFTTFQSFAVFAAIIQGAWLFVVLGLILLATGLLFDRARRGIAANLNETGTPTEGAGR